MNASHRRNSLKAMRDAEFEDTESAAKLQSANWDVPTTPDTFGELRDEYVGQPRRHAPKTAAAPDNQAVNGLYRVDNGYTWATSPQSTSAPQQRPRRLSHDNLQMHELALRQAAYAAEDRLREMGANVRDSYAQAQAELARERERRIAQHTQAQAEAWQAERREKEAAWQMHQMRSKELELLGRHPSQSPRSPCLRAPSSSLSSPQQVRFGPGAWQMPPTPGASPNTHRPHPPHGTPSPVHGPPSPAYGPPSPAAATPRSKGDDGESARGSSRGSSAGSRYVANYEKYTISQAIHRAKAFEERTEHMKETNRLLAKHEVRRLEQEVFLAPQREAAEMRQMEVDEDYDRRRRAIINGPGLSEFDSQFF